VFFPRGALEEKLLFDHFLALSLRYTDPLLIYLFFMPKAGPLSPGVKATAVISLSLGSGLHCDVMHQLQIH
jgi:hypothetical protein